ncbi:genetic competence negative regulator [Mechercharimyces sp. CAU 1602]|uniref:genetic competence negative regulator n=1 Tax=Mechercharimyces sp. CAU 1602 TaxID=2973933 RepID=UPI002163C4CC|nr:genetic competence negative regulator [Mechercharimyces sp. CAU 1602]MCS1350956.1 genetic competence negative regulator [Mechercharimyces sp. CAU 1602]
MRVERLDRDKIRFFLSLDDLAERGIKKEDMWHDMPKVHELFNDMMEQAYHELGFEVSGPVAVEVYAMPAQGMIVVVSRGTSPKLGEDPYDYDAMYELEVTMEESDEISFRFGDFEDLIQAAKRAETLGITGGKVFSYKDKYYLLMDVKEDTQYLQGFVALLSEFGEATTVSEAVLAEYGTLIWKENALKEINHYFS